MKESLTKRVIAGKLLGSLLLGLLLLPIGALGQEVLVYENGPIHMESAGGWIAVERRFYGKLNVREVQGNPEISVFQKVAEEIKGGKIAFGVASPEDIIRAGERDGAEFVAVSVDFQSSPLRIISWKPIRAPKDITGHFGIWPGYEARPQCVVGKGKETQFTLQIQGDDLRPWFSQQWPLASAMSYDGLLTVQREVKKMGKKFYTVDYKDLGIDWMDHCLITTVEIVKNYPEVVQTVVTARYKGFQWAFQNPKETVELLRKTNGSLSLAREMDAVSPIKSLMKSADTNQFGLGYIQPRRWQAVAKDLLRAGLLEKMPDIERTYTTRFPSSVTGRISE